MIQKTILIIILLLAFAVASNAQQTTSSCDNKFSVSSIGLSFCLPSEWIVKDRDNEQSQVAYGTQSNGIFPTINIKTGIFKGALSEYVKAGVEYLLTTSKKETNAKSLEIESKKEFTAGALRGYRLVINSEHQDSYKLRTIQYAFEGKGDTKIVITCTMSPIDKERMDEFYDKTMQTLKLAK